MSIRNNVFKVKKKILDEVDADDQPFTNEVQQKSLAAIPKGITSPEWETYMELFVDADRPDQLARLTATDGTDTNPAMNSVRAYLVANGPCGTDTVLNFGKAVTLVLDEGLPE